MHSENEKKLNELMNQIRSEPETFLSSSSIASALFEKASPEYLKNKTLEQLKSITDIAQGSLNSILSDSKLDIKIEFDNNFGSLWVAQGDRPFIVNTLSEIIRSHGGQIIACLHPIILNSNVRLSLTYIEFSGIPASSKQQIQEAIVYKLGLLETVTGDYSDISFEIKNMALTLEADTATQELGEFLHWLADGCFVFLGLRVAQKSLGLFKDEGISGEINSEIFQSNQALNLFKLTVISPIHRRSPMLCFHIPELKIYILGLFTSKALGLQSSSIPIIRKKLKQLLDQENVLDNSYDYGNIIDIVDSMPKDELFNISVEELKNNIRTIQGLQDSNASKLSIRFDSAKKGVSCLVLIPKDSFNARVRDQIQKLLEKKFNAQNSQYHLDFTDPTHARLYFYLPSSTTLNTDVDLIAIQEQISILTKNWSSELQAACDQSNLLEIFYKVKAGLPEKYKESTPIDLALIDLKFLNQLSEKCALADFQKNEENHFFSVYSKNPLSLSRIMPTLENIGLEVISEDFSKVQTGTEDLFIQRFKVNIKENFNHQNFLDQICNNFQNILAGVYSDSVLLKLCSYTSMNLRAVMLMRAYSDYFWQTNKFTTRANIYRDLSSHPEITKLFWDLFDKKFNPASQNSFDNTEVIEALKNIKDPTTDRIFRVILDFITNTVRTNYYFSDDGIAFKIDASKTGSIPSPKPLYEIYVSAPDFEGIHLRSSKVSRGGIRWSDRLQDFRVEILGLMRTQKIKNALIVPEGAKGGFIVKDQSKTGKEYLELGKNTYKRYVRNLLTLADNLIEDKISRNPKLINYDGDDAYFVVAADKGTATFSDTANEIATKEFNFWLDDAFASGGSKGYDHKKYGITARGAWKCVERHFRDLGIDYHTSFTAIGIGDMSGDVFGNGLIISDKVKLIAAFNHKHIFVDPNPNPETSYVERLRLFNTPGSQWSDYQGLSQGGEIYERSNREISLSKEACESLGVSFPIKMTADELVSTILKAPVDLLWNGGIGTYIKATQQQHAEVNDGTNDLVRVNASEVRAKVIGEGGNLGLTQKARIEFAKLGGAINTDAIDNSGGVDLSDHEVNLKILFADLIKNNKVTVEERDKILVDLAIPVCNQVLSHNASHALILTIGKLRSVVNNTYLSSLITLISNQGFINRQAEELPDDQELENRLENDQGLLRPELAVLLAGTKLQIKNEIKKSKLYADPYLEKYLLSYFPETLRERFPDYIKKHKLRDDIIATEVTNQLLDAVGITFIHRMCLNYQVDISAVVKCTIIAIEILDSLKLREAFAVYDKPGSIDKFLELCHELGKATRELTAWLVKVKADKKELSETILLYSSEFSKVISSQYDQIVASFEDLKLIEASLKEFEFDSKTAKKMVLFNKLTLCFEVIQDSLKYKADFGSLLKVYKNLETQTGFFSIINAGIKLKDLSKWDFDILLSSIDQIWKTVSQLSQLPEKDYKNIKTMANEILRHGVTPSALYAYSKTLANYL